MNKQTNAIYCVLLMLTIWCTWNSVKSSNLISVLTTLDTEVSIMTREVGFLMDRLDVLETIEPKEVIREEVELPVEVKAVIQ